MNTTLFSMLNTPEIIAILVIVLVLFGAKKLPELARGLGHGIKEFKKATRDVTDELHQAMDQEPPPPPPKMIAPPVEPHPVTAGTVPHQAPTTAPTEPKV
jgi:sec-independent protein translocase protein TatA